MVEYNAQSIETLSFRDAIRTRVAMYMGSADNMGVLQCIRELITNSIDEATMGFGKRITVDLFSEIIQDWNHHWEICTSRREDEFTYVDAIYLCWFCQCVRTRID